MSIAKTIEISATSSQSFDDAVKQGVQRVCKTVRGVRDLWVKDMKARVENGQVVEYRVHMLLTFEVND